MAESLAQQMTEEQKQELMSQLTGADPSALAPAAAPATPTLAAPESSQGASDADLAAAIAAE